ncbi:TPA: ASCH domain-containing protein [Elizabethkingia anophelis]
MKVILSIKPVYAIKILEGQKTYELRKTIFKNKEINKVLIYASSPISKIIGEFEIDEIIHQDVNNLWPLIKDKSAVEKKFYDEYFYDKEKGYAIGIKNVKKYNQHIDIYEEYGIRAPQSFAYIK